MSNKKFYTILIAVIAVGMIATVAHAIYIYNAYVNTSIIHFVSQEEWG